MTELCHSVKEFVNLTSEGTLPDALLSMKGAQATQALLHGMLSDFIVEETLKSPFWVFAALSHGDKIDLESPCLLFNNFQSLTPIGLKMPDLPIWNSHLAQPAAKGVSIETQGAKLRMGLPPLTTAIASAPGPKTPGHGLSDKALHVPDAHSMENLYRILMNVNETPARLHTWRSQLMRMLSEGGISLLSKQAKNDDSRMFVEARESYARKLKDRFLSGAARFLLQQDQDPVTIDKLETRLLSEIDAALRFSCQAWSRQDPLRFRGLCDLPASFSSSGSPGKLMDLCLDYSDRAEQPTSLRSYDGQSVVMIIQPTVETVRATRSPTDPKATKEVSRIWSKARVLVHAPPPSKAPHNTRAGSRPPPRSRRGSHTSQVSDTVTFCLSSDNGWL